MTASSVLASARRGHRGLFGFAVAMAVLSVVLIVAAILDDRTVLGAPVWFKPLKFAVSFVLYAGALAWLIDRLEPRGRWVSVAAWLVVVSSFIEMAIITGQAARGRRSHFNEDTALDAGLFIVMGVTIGVLYVATLVIAVQVIRQPGPDRVLTQAIRYGLLVAVLGLSVGFVMVAIDAHAVGVEDGGPGLFFTGWSTTGGDLRVAHFAGMHALQLIPLSAAVLIGGGSVSGRWSETTQLRLIGILAGSYAAVVLLLVLQALRGQPLVSPDLLTLGLLAVILVVVGVSTLRALRSERVDVRA